MRSSASGMCACFIACLRRISLALGAAFYLVAALFCRYRSR